MATHSTLFTLPGFAAFTFMCGTLVFLLVRVAGMA